MSAVEETDGCFIQFGSWKPKSVVFDPTIFQRSGIVFKFGDQGPDHCKELHIKLDARDILKCEYNLQRVLPTIFLYTTSYFGRIVRQKLKLVKGSGTSPYFNPLSRTEKEKRVVIQLLHPCDESEQQRFLDVFNAMAAHTKRLMSEVFIELQPEVINPLILMISKSKASGTASSSSLSSDDDDPDDVLDVVKESKSRVDSTDGEKDERIADGIVDETDDTSTCRSLDDADDDVVDDHDDVLDVIEGSESKADTDESNADTDSIDGRIDKLLGMSADTSRSLEDGVDDDHDDVLDVVEESESKSDTDSIDGRTKKWIRTLDTYRIFEDTSKSSDEDWCSETSDRDALTASTGGHLLPASSDKDSLSGSSDEALELLDWFDPGRGTSEVAGSSSSSSSSSEEESDGRLKTVSRKRPVVSSSDESDSSVETVVVKRPLISSDDESGSSFETGGMKRISDVRADKCADKEEEDAEVEVSAVSHYDSDHDDVCEGCRHGPGGHGGQLLLCNQCPTAYHKKCVDPPLSKVPSGAWICPICEAQANGKKRKIDRKKKIPNKGAKDIQCKYYQQCIQVQEAIGLPEALLDLNSEYNKCYCQKCHDERGEGDQYIDGPGPHNLYTKPIGWGRIMLKLPPRAHHLSIFQNWNVAYHGTSVKNLIRIVEGGDLLIPGDKTMHGEIIEEVAGHYNNHRKPNGFNTKQVFLSPSIKYAGCDVYAKQRMLRLYNDTVKKTRYVNVRTVLQVRIKPDQYRVGRQTIGRNTQIDPPIPNSTIEWSTEARNAVIPTAVLIQVTESIAPEQSSSICPICRVLLTGVNHPATRTCKHQHVICKKCDEKYRPIYGDTCVLCSLPLSVRLKKSKVKEIRRSAKAFRVAGKKARRRDKHKYDITVFVELPMGEPEAIQVCPSTTIEELKGEIEARVSMPVAQQRIIFARKQLEDGRTLSDYNMTDNCVVQLVQRLCGN